MKRIAILALWPLCLLAALIAAVWLLLAGLAGSPRAWRLVVAHDQLANAATGGSEDETISSRAGKARRHGRRWACVLCRLLDAIDRGHCERSIEPDEGDTAATVVTASATTAATTRARVARRSSTHYTTGGHHAH